ncbi:DUF481 domain-containing protein [Desulfurivibrio alkaliphilus]|uniref:DUF481 domain-containing protein n=1 Tax=Desulfurivibrio alkaliphilus (strain DSM 19089 / UNIQEM U267 / AHT2) TaxID=589865 RepID=D6Z5Q4_DESAT|nr:DUF481 domain-containing protein [Desulfurivibrio alkaliphilus]ADH86791.1 protein of unknown function DUF481 [Desulfurivibrio alkaliphilus AHT 2]
MFFRFVQVLLAMLVFVVPAAAEPEALSATEAGEEKLRRWLYEAALDLAGKEGNTREFGLGGSLTAVLKGPDDALKLIAEYERKKTDGEKSTDQMLGVVDYESFPSKYLGWYIRTALEKDVIERVKLRSTSGTGLSYRLINQEHHTLVARSGIGYRYTRYDNDIENDSDPTMDLGLIHRYEFGRQWSLRNEVTYSPSLDDFDDYRILHDSALEVPVGVGDFWKLRMGVRNDYNNQPVVEERLDTTYYTRLVVSWQ